MKNKNKRKKFVHNAPIPKALEVSAMEAIMEPDDLGLEDLGVRFGTEVEILLQAGFKRGVNRLGGKLVLFGYDGYGWRAILMERKEYREAIRLARAIKRVDPHRTRDREYWCYTEEDKRCSDACSEALGYLVYAISIRNNRLAREDRTRYLAMELIHYRVV